jgi:nucleoside-diphosphate-sugar epimerase
MSITSNQPASLSCFNGSTVLITGAGGFIGGHLIAALKNLGANIIGIDRKPSTGIHGADVSNADQVHQIFKLSSINYCKTIEYVFHLAGQKSASLAKENPSETLSTSFIGNLNILESARRIGTVKKVILISSLAVYGLDEDGSNEILKESHSLENDSIYSATKISTEAVGLAYSKDFGIPVSIARLANVYGPLQSPAAVIPSLIAQMKSGETITMGNTAPIRDFIHVQDVVDALLHLAATESSSGNVFNVSTAQGTSIKKVTEILMKYLNYKGQIATDERKVRPNEKIHLVADNSAIQVATGWTPKIKIEDGLKSLCQ